MATRLPDLSQQAAADAVVDRTDAGGAGSLKIYSGTQPADADTAPSGTLLVSIALAATAFGSASSAGTASLASTPRSGTGVAAGTAGWYRVVSGGGATVYDGAVGSGELVLDNTSIAVGQTVNINSLTYTQPGT
ncbi:hypothetical protein [Amycolatopsis sp. NPDC001319]|uniref:hypothetical protein n=1 Tax=unclassified Amycolatopsis TaxID=2618356 RepID=UPI003696C38F